MELMQANRQWATRPADERFTSLLELRDMATASRMNSGKATVESNKIRFTHDDGDSEFKGLHIVGPRGNPIAPTNWAFGQIAARVGAPAAYLRKLSAPIVAAAMNESIQASDRESLQLLIGMNPNDGTPETLRAATGAKYGRVWNAEIADSLVKLFGDGVTGEWKVPGTFGNALDKVTKENTTIYGSDRDCFVFLADEVNRIEIPNRRNGKEGSLARGVFVWNSEVGSASFGMAAFLFDYVCSNRIVWGATEYRESRFRHTASAPDKWLHEVAPIIQDYANASAAPVQRALIAAQSAKVDNVREFLQGRFSKRMADAIQLSHMDEEGRPMETLWDIATGVTAYAKGIVHQNERVLVEREAGKILDMAA